MRALTTLYIEICVVLQLQRLTQAAGIGRAELAVVINGMACIIYQVDEEPPSSLRCCSSVRFFIEMFNSRFSETLSITERVLYGRSDH